MNPPVEPMLAKSASVIPTAPGMHYEPKWDGYRCIVFRDGEEVVLGSRGGKQLERYFPEVVAAVVKELPAQCVLDGELIVVRDHRLDFDLLNQRIHPSARRIAELAEATPARFVAFDVLADAERSYLDHSYAARRVVLEQLIGAYDGQVRTRVIHRTPVTTDPATAARWFTQFEGAGLDGVIAKASDVPYAPGKRLMVKVKHHRTADVVVAGYRRHRSLPGVGSLMLGLYTDTGDLNYVGVCSAFTGAQRVELAVKLEPYRNLRSLTSNHPWQAAEGSGTPVPTRLPGGQNRWSAGRDTHWEPLRPELVAEVSYDHTEDDRFRHIAQFCRWRTDRGAESCDYSQLAEPVSYDLQAVLEGRV
ncbi:MAG: ATP-dependent DNA ligase [Mycobacteriales bacterium]